MERYDTGSTPDPFARSVSAFESLTAPRSGRGAGEWTHAELEEHLDHTGRALIRPLLQDHVDLRAIREEQQARDVSAPRLVGPEGTVRPWREPGHEGWLACLFGQVRVCRVAHRGTGVGNVHPADVCLSLPAGRHFWACGAWRSPRSSRLL
jgi:hypothetical protein